MKMTTSTAQRTHTFLVEVSIIIRGLIITIIVRENLRLLTLFTFIVFSKKLERSTRRVSGGAWGRGNMANQFTVHKVVAACVIGDWG